MSWLSNSTTRVSCNDPDHRGGRVVTVETAYHITAREAMIKSGWGYDQLNQVHICPKCIARNVRRN